MPTKKDGTAGSPDAPQEPGTALDADDAQSGGTEAAPVEGVDHTPETFSLESVSVSDIKSTPADDPDRNDSLA